MPTLVANIKREHIEAFVAYLLENRTASTASNRYRGLKRFFRWLEEDGEIKSDPWSE